jgi:2-keto-4-pentenoate hydratase
MFDPERVAQFFHAGHRTRAPYCNVPAEFAPASVAEAYAAQRALARLLEPGAGEIAGLKIATTTPIMQQLMGIDHPCAGLIFASTVKTSPARIKLADYVNLRLECELAVRLERGLPATAAPFTAANVAAAVGHVMTAFELIEDRNADYSFANALSLIADNCWNAGVVLGSATGFDGIKSLTGIAGSVTIDGEVFGSGLTDDPLAALAWLANVAVEQGHSIDPGMIVITGSIIPTFTPRPGQQIAFALEGIGAAELVATERSA